VSAVLNVEAQVVFANIYPKYCVYIIEDSCKYMRD